MLPARLTDVFLRGRILALLFRTADGRHPAVEVPLDPARAGAVRCLCWLHGHRSGCRARSDVHVGLLLQCIGALGGGGATVVVQPRPLPRFHLRMDRDGEVRLVELGTLDALCLLLSKRIPVRLAGPPGGDWDAALRRLLDEEGGPGSEGE